MANSELNFSNTYERIVVLVDMDCFYCQVEEKLNPELKGKPMAVVQYNSWMGGGIIAVNYPARARGVTRHMRGDEAKKHCPEIELVKVPSVREKADLTKYREAGKDVARVLQTFTASLERASVDEAYLDISTNVLERMKAMDRGEYFITPENVADTFAVGHKSFGEFVKSVSTRMSSGSEESEELEDFRAANASCRSEEKDVKRRNELKLLVAATIVNDIRRAVKEETEYECSAGVAHNKILAKLVAGLNKPNKQTIISIDCVQTLFEEMPILKVRGLGGKFGEIVCQKLNVKFMGDLLEFSESELRKAFNDKDGTWLYYLARGIDLEPVVTRLISKSIGCTKKFPGKGAIVGVKTLTHWLKELASEVVDRLEKDEQENNRRGKLLTVIYTQTINKEDIASTRSIHLDAYDAQKIAEEAFEVIKKNSDVFYLVDNPSNLNNPIKLLGYSVGKFERNPLPKKNPIQEMFKKQESKKNAEKEQEAEKSSENEGFFQQFLEKDAELEERPETPDPSTSLIVEKTPEKSEQNTSDGFFNDFLEKEAESFLEPQPSTSRSGEKVSTESEKTKTPKFKSPNEEIYEALTPEYKKTYAEFAKPELPEEFMTVCEMCNKRISKFEAASHADFHFALKLSQEQRSEFRRDFKGKISAPAAKKMKVSKSSTLPNIKKFFSSSEDVGQSQGGGATELCPKCEKQVPVDEMVQHSDYHIAKELQQQMNREETLSQTSQKWTQVSQVEKVKKGAAKAGNKSPKFQSIASYFNK